MLRLLRVPVQIDAYADIVTCQTACQLGPLEIRITYQGDVPAASGAIPRRRVKNDPPRRTHVAAIGRQGVPRHLLGLVNPRVGRTRP